MMFSHLVSFGTVFGDVKTFILCVRDSVFLFVFILFIKISQIYSIQYFVQL